MIDHLIADWEATCLPACLGTQIDGVSITELYSIDRHTVPYLPTWQCSRGGSRVEGRVTVCVPEWAGLSTLTYMVEVRGQPSRAGAVQTNETPNCQVPGDSRQEPSGEQARTKRRRGKNQKAKSDDEARETGSPMQDDRNTCMEMDMT